MMHIVSRETTEQMGSSIVLVMVPRITASDSTLLMEWFLARSKLFQRREQGCGRRPNSKETKVNKSGDVICYLEIATNRMLNKLLAILSQARNP
ncbi:hypothetical protein [Bacillus sp. V5-8f]|uniref:hypothetical protein n=1 Tax=Bacillus sp. V5-8f TaxID=2053044 RepID=UPI000C7671A1|nr:hypothetical protein [Bacillus sp. V5-8f]PLT34469.1 hypothetical protein CUU64_09640 [Bacillus sp. V5-8f]